VDVVPGDWHEYDDAGLQLQYLHHIVSRAHTCRVQELYNYGGNMHIPATIDYLLQSKLGHWQLAISIHDSIFN